MNRRGFLGTCAATAGGAALLKSAAAQADPPKGEPFSKVALNISAPISFFRGAKVEDKIEVGRWYLDGPYTMTVGKAMRFHGDVENRPFVRSVSEQIMRRIIRLSQQSEQRMNRPNRPFTPKPVEYANA